MNTLQKKLTIALGAVSVLIGAAAHATPTPNALNGDGIGRTPAEIEIDSSATDQRLEVANLVVADDHQLAFLFDPETRELTLQESAPINDSAAVPLLMRNQFLDLDPLEIYLALTPAERAVPRVLIEISERHEARELAAGRPVVESLKRMPAHIVRPRRARTYKQHDSMPQLCGVNGKAAFESICKTNRTREQHCASGKNTWAQLTSDGKYKKSEGLAVSCQASVQTRHWWRGVIRWKGPKIFNHDVSGVWLFTRVYHNVRKLRRRVRMDRYNPTNPSSKVSYIRAWIGFRN